LSTAFGIVSRTKFARTMNPLGTHGSFSWPELMTSDPARTAEFYSNVFGWTTETMPMPPGGEYTLCRAGGVPCAGMMA
jgi:hypothetical protein